MDKFRAPWMSPEPPPHLADTSAEHGRALELVREVIAAETAFNNPDLAHPDAGISPETTARLARWVDQAYRAFTAHLVEHRAVLGTHPHWALDYELIDTPGDDVDPEQGWDRP